ncbi:hypothetical protein K8Q93_02210 [Candidatus Parcubacteria bacterium]|nr:hypothetical protein [Candidatus Parcubacteria bacterium]
MARDIRTGIDIGSHNIKVVVCERTNDKDLPKILATACVESKGLRHGYIVSDAEVAESVRLAVAEAEKQAQIKIKEAFLAVGGVGLESIISSGSAVVSRGDAEISDLDVDKAHEAARLAIPQNAIINRRILHPIPLHYKTDGRDVLGNRPVGLKAMKVEVRMLFVTYLDKHLQDLIQAVENAGVEVVDAMAAPIAASLVSLTKTQKMAGCVLANIGAETVSIVVYENGAPVSLEVFPIGSTDITNDIALGLKVSLEEAERIKLGAITNTNFSKKRLDEIVVARLSDIFDLIEAHLKKLGRSGLLPAGIIITGGGSGLSSIEDLAKAALKLPSKVALLTVPQGGKQQVKDATWSVAYGLCIWGFSGDSSRPRENVNFGSMGKRFWKSLGEGLKPFLP